ncbi:beta-lactamase L2 [Lysobacter antibioticus]|uniref:class A beta-lactamase n=1 Tax=Lysobacter antibioticus TaxID=84531 RepID=UPI0007173688|nr:class A beta-lactamase [Lysobacter antibioticus]ALN63937.1 beta-lactamase L2 [Lysobacter antibioticus]
MHRRDFLHCASGLLLTAGLGPHLNAFAKTAATAPTSHWSAQLRVLEKNSGGRLGVGMLDTGSGQHFDWRGRERFPMCSTFKFLLAAAVLREVERGKLDLQKKIPIAKSDLIAYSPVTEPLAGSSASVAQLCEATMTLSDNTAANLLLPLVGNPAGLTTFLRGIGDPTTRLDRKEPELNSAIPGDPRDTTSPLAMVATMRKLLLQDGLQPASQKQLTAWLVANRTGDKRLRAGVPKGARVGDKTGTADTTSNDLAIIWLPERAPILLTCYLTGSTLDGPGRDAIHASVARLVFGPVEPR